MAQLEPYLTKQTGDELRKEFISLQAEIQGDKEFTKLKYLLGRKRLRLNYRETNDETFMPKVE